MDFGAGADTRLVWSGIGMASLLLTRGLASVRAEFSLTAFADNLKRVIAIVGVPRL
ncbi:MAG: hypothetical protein ABIO78_08465 [Thermoanaerobaculia bacterium]